MFTRFFNGYGKILGGESPGGAQGVPVGAGIVADIDCGIVRGTDGDIAFVIRSHDHEVSIRVDGTGQNRYSTPGLATVG